MFSLRRLPIQLKSVVHGGFTPVSSVQCRFYRHHTHPLQVEEGRALSYSLQGGQKQPTVLLVPGLHSYTHMQGVIAHCLKRYCDLNEYPFVMYDHECTGESKSMSDINKVLFTHWVEDLLCVINKLTEGPIVLVGASLGGWLSLIAAQRIPKRLHGMVLYAPAVNYVYPYYLRHLESLPKQVRERLDAGDIHVHAHSFGDALLKKDFAEDSLRYEIDLKKPVKIDCPIRIIHGLQDKEIDPDTSMQLIRQIVSTDIDLIYRKSCPHQLDSPMDLEMFINILDRLMKTHPVRS